MPTTTIRETISINASAETIFALYANASDWKNWDPDVAEVDLPDGLKTGSNGYLRVQKGPRQAIRIAAVSTNRSFTVTSRLPFCLITFEHELSTKGTETLAVHSVTFSGLLAGLFGRLVGSQIKKTLPLTMAGLKRAAEQAR